MLTVTGDYFVAVHDKDYRCRFGGPTAEVDRQATLVNITTLVCMSPPRPWLLAQTVDDEETLHRLVFDDGSALPASTEVGGDAEPNGIALKLTDSTPGRSGSFSVGVPNPELPLAYFSLTAEVLIGGGGASAGGEGVHLFFGDSEGVAASVALVDGLSLLLLTRQFVPPPPFVAEFTEEDIDTWGDPHYTPPLDTGTYVEKVVVAYDGVPLLEEAPPSTLRTNLFFVVDLDVAADGALLKIDGVEIGTRVAVPGWRPQPYWRCGAAAATGADQKGDQHWVRLLHARGRRLPTMARVALAVSTNAQQYSTEAHEVTYLGGSRFSGADASPHAAPLVLSAVSPSAGPLHGGTAVTITGANLGGGTAYRCRFGGGGGGGHGGHGGEGRMGLDVVPATFVAHPTTKAWAGPTGTEAARRARCDASLRATRRARPSAASSSKSRRMRSSSPLASRTRTTTCPRSSASARAAARSTAARASS